MAAVGLPLFPILSMSAFIFRWWRAAKKHKSFTRNTQLKTTVYRLYQKSFKNFIVIQCETIFVDGLVNVIFHFTPCVTFLHQRNGLCRRGAHPKFERASAQQQWRIALRRYLKASSYRNNYLNTHAYAEPELHSERESDPRAGAASCTPSKQIMFHTSNA